MVKSVNNKKTTLQKNKLKLNYIYTLYNTINSEFFK